MRFCVNPACCTSQQALLTDPRHTWPLMVGAGVVAETSVGGRTELDLRFTQATRYFLVRA